MDPFLAVIAVGGIAAGAIASVTGFGIGSLLTPLLAIQVGTRLAVAAVSLPHVIGTAQRLWLLRAHVDRRILIGFGAASAAGGLAGALVQSLAPSRALAVDFGVALILAGVAELTGWMRRIRWSRGAAWVAGVLSGLLGGLVGNQGGIRAAALLGFEVPRESFVATATATALVVDAARIPVYLMTQGPDIARLGPQLAIAVGGVVVGTAIGTRVLGRLDDRMFRITLGVALIVLGMVTGVGAVA